MHHSQGIPPATGGNRCNRRRLASRLRDPETSILTTPLAKSTKTNLQEGLICETVVTFRSPRALNCETVLTFSLFWTPPLCGKREKCDTLLTFQCLTLWTHVFHDTFASPTIGNHEFHDAFASATIGNHIFYDTFATPTIGNHVFYDTFASPTIRNHVFYDTFASPGYQNARLSTLFFENCTSLREYRRRPPATGHNRCTRGRLAGRLRDPETSILATPLAKSTETNLQEGQIRETVITFRSPRALNCETVLRIAPPPPLFFSFFLFIPFCRHSS